MTGEKPRFRAYRENLFKFIADKPVKIDGRCYSFADRPMLILMQLGIIIFVITVYNFSPFSTHYYQAVLGRILAALLGIVLSVLYWLFFVYRFARFYVEWADSKVPAQGYDSFSNPADHKENKRKAWISRGAFGLLAVFLTATMWAYSFFGYGIAHVRLYNKQEKLDKLIDICGRCEAVSFVCDGFLFVIGSPADRNELSRLFSQLKGSYIGYLCKLYQSPDRIYIGLNAIWGDASMLVWYEKEMTRAQVAEDNRKNQKDIAQLDAHWWHVRNP